MNYFRSLPLLCQGEKCGTCEDLYFEDGTWLLRQLVAVDGVVFKKRSLVSPESIDRAAFVSDSEAIPLTISKAELESAPPFESELPFSRAVELAALSHYKLAPYWLAGVGTGGIGMGTGYASNEVMPAQNTPVESDSNLRSLNAVLGYEVINGEEALGETCDLILDLTDFSVAYLAVDTKPSEKGGVRLVSTTQKDVQLRIDYATNSFRTDYNSSQLLESPSADLSSGRLSLGDQQKVDLSSY